MSNKIANGRFCNLKKNNKLQMDAINIKPLHWSHQRHQASSTYISRFLFWILLSVANLVKKMSNSSVDGYSIQIT